MTRLKWMAGLAVAIINASAMAQDKPPASLDSLKGTWTADCTAFAPGARCKLQWTEGLHKNLLRVVYEVRNAAGNRLFAGEGVYQRTDDSFAGFWTDTNGSLHPLKATYVNAALTTYWGRTETEEGKTRYELKC